MSAVTPAGGDTAAGRSWPALLNGLLEGRDLSADDTAWAMDLIMRGEATDAQIAGFAVALRAKGETVQEITGLVRTMYEHANVIEVPGRTVDIVGTGGDGAKTVNISTMSAIVIARHRREGRQARQSGRLLRVRRLGRPGEARRQSGADAEAGGRGRRGGRDHLLLRDQVPSGAASCGRSARAVGDPNHLQRARSADQPGQGEGAGRGRRRPPPGTAHHAASWPSGATPPSSSAATTASTS